MTAEARQALEGLDEEASVAEVATRLEGRVSPAVLSLVKAQVVQAGGFGTVTRAVEGFGGFAKQYEQIEKVSAHHANCSSACAPGRERRPPTPPSARSAA